MPEMKAFGTWESPIQPEDFEAPGSVVLSQVEAKGGKIYRLEIRADEGGRGVIVQSNVDGSGEKELLSKSINVASQVHEYGGGAFTVGDSHIVFTDWETKGVFGLDPDTGETIPLLEADMQIYYADFAINPLEPHLTVAIQERHDVAKIADVKNSLVVIDSGKKEVRTIAEGADFYTSPRFSNSGMKICWVQFNAPNMPWDDTELWLADWVDGTAKNAQCIAGRQVKASITQPRWSRDDTLFWVSDETDWWQIYSWRNDKIEHLKLTGLQDTEFGFADWFLGGSSYVLLTANILVACFNVDDRWTVIMADMSTLEWRDLSCPIVEITTNTLQRVSDTSFAIIGATTSLPMLLTVVDINEGGLGTVLKVSSPKSIPESYVSVPHPITFPRINGSGDAHGFWYAPKNAEYEGPPGSLPPLIVAVHGGPTYQEGTGFSLRDHALTTRGYALLQVNYAGSTGYGRKYRDSLKGRWGLCSGNSDVGDATAGVQYLVQQGLVDRHSTAICGHSAGGYSTLQALATRNEVWACGVAESGISDMKLLVEETHKFESHYLEPLCFPQGSSAAEQAAIIKDRSPVTHAANIKAPLLIINGADDPIVPPNQAYNLAKLVNESGVPVEVKVYDGEGHIFNKDKLEVAGLTE
ncbi:hypothetical protein H2200_013540 [Cladophialophora chaetospira]|uniref:Peptidase S9 prolyl oligopeptidase catalytic domain-containing protein n=1 Tax=Cladophialophora chaetospira TaxID=386627 RepID=A0AA38U7N1_9EURO|nr:hypothetical protein H2200_013540 [Cladophialophora chaetospira]